VGNAGATLDMLPYELRPVALPSYPHPIASVQDCHIGSPAEESAALLPSSTATPNDEWLEAALVVDESTGEDVLEVALNLSFIERQLGTSSAEAVRATQRLTREAFTVTGGADVHRLLHRLGGSTGSRLMQAATDRQGKNYCWKG
jgi:hypothetical protein